MSITTSDPHVYTAKEVKHMREIAYAFAQLIFERDVSPHSGQAYQIALLQYAESVAQTYIQAGVSPGDFNAYYHELKNS